MNPPDGAATTNGFLMLASPSSDSPYASIPACLSLRFYVRPCVPLSLSLSVRLFIIFVRPNVLQSISITVRLFVCPSVRLSIRLSMSPFIRMSVSLSVGLSVSLSVRISVS